MFLAELGLFWVLVAKSAKTVLWRRHNAAGTGL